MSDQDKTPIDRPDAVSVLGGQVAALSRRVATLEGQLKTRVNVQPNRTLGAISLPRRAIDKVAPPVRPGRGQGKPVVLRARTEPSAVPGGMRGR